MKLDCEPVQESRIEWRLCMLYKMVNELPVVDTTDSAILSTSQNITRGSHSQKFETLRDNIDTLKYSFFPRTVCDCL